MARSRLVTLAALAVSVGSTAFGADAQPATQPAPKPVAGDGTYAVPTAAQVQAWYALNKPAVAGGIYSLDQFGKVGNAKDAQAAFAAAEEHIINSGGGILLIPIETDWNWKPQSTGQRELRTPAPPASTKNWREGVGMTIFDARGNKPTLYPAPITGLTIKRVLDLKQGDSLPHWNYNPVIDIQNTIAFGSTSYHDWLQQDVEPGTDARFYVPTIRGLFPGMFITANAWSTIERICIKALGYDKEKHAWYFTADVEKPFKKGTIMSNKNHVNALKMETKSHNENQTFDLCIWRHNYSQGDNYLIDARFKYMGDVHSTAGDENGVIFAGFVEAHTDAFNGKVESWNPQTSELRFTGAKNADTLGSGRPIININPKKCVTEGKVWIVRPGGWTDDSSKSDTNPVFKGQTYPTTIAKNPLGITSLRVGGLIRFTADAPVTPECVGRYFAVTEPDETAPSYSHKATGVRRWYLIDSVTVNPDKTKDIRIIRHWWGAKSAGSPTLYNPANYSADGSEKPLAYIIAPGVNAYDVSDGVPGVGKGNLLRLSPAPFTGTAFDFEPGDPIEQAIGPDPFHPQTMRTWTWDQVPSMFPGKYFDIANNGEVQRHTVFGVRGGSGDLARDIDYRWTHTSVFDRILDINGTSQNAIVFGADVANAALQFKQPHLRAQPIKWSYGRLPIEPAAEDSEKSASTAPPTPIAVLPGVASLTVAPESGVMTLEALAVAVPSGVTKASGLSGSDIRANNLRGIKVPVKAGAKELVIKFAKPEADGEYAVFIETSWITQRAVAEQTAEGFTVKFDAAPAADAKLHWMIVR